MIGAWVAGLVAAAVGALLWCVSLTGVLGSDPMLGFEVAAAMIAWLWSGFVLRDLLASRRLAAALEAESDPTSIFGVPCRVTEGLGADAIVLGSVRPRIYVGASLVEALTQEELRAVMYHEDHHRRTRAPLRAAALTGWLRLLGRSRTARARIVDRLADLECLADADAIRRGSTRRALARALLKGDRTVQPASFSYLAERRVERLLELADDAGIQSGRLPFEWLPVVFIAVVIVGCHTGL